MRVPFCYRNNIRATALELAGEEIALLRQEYYRNHSEYDRFLRAYNRRSFLITVFGMHPEKDTMRTDSVTIAREAQDAALAFIRESYGEAYLPPKPNFYKNKAAAQEAHEAIRPTDVRRTPELMAQFLDSSQLRLYTLIWRRFVASQMAPAIQNLTTVDVMLGGADSHAYTFRATATVPVFAGFSKVYEEEKKSKSESHGTDHSRTHNRTPGGH